MIGKIAISILVIILFIQFSVIVDAASFGPSGLTCDSGTTNVYDLEKAGQITRRIIGMASLCYPKR